MRISERGQFTIPAQLRELLGLLPGTEVELERVGNSVRVRMARSRQRRGQALVDHLRGRRSVRMTTGIIMALTR